MHVAYFLSVFSSHLTDMYSPQLLTKRPERKIKSNQILKTIKILYCYFMSSILVYALQVGNPQYDKYIQIIESVQKQFLKHLEFKTKVYNPGNISRCKRCYILPLTQSRIFLAGLTLYLLAFS